MSLSLNRAFLLVLITVAAQHSAAQSNSGQYPGVLNGPHLFWNSVNGPYGGGAEALHVHAPASWWLGTFGGVYTSTNQGVSWTLSGLQGKEIFRIGSNATTILASSDSTLYRSTNDGTTWDSVWQFPSLIQSIARMNGTLLVSLDANGGGPSSTGGGVFASTDNGSSWSRMMVGQFSRAGVRGVVVIGNTVVSVTNRNGVMRSTNGGTTWEAASSGLPSPRPEIYSVNTRDGDGAEIVIAGAGPSLYFSADQGASWTRAACAGIPAGSDLYSVAFNGTTGVAATLGDTTFITTDNGGTWRMLGGSFPQGAAVYSVTPAAGSFLAGLDRGVHGSEDGTTWRAHRAGQNAAQVTALAAHQGPAASTTTLFAAGEAGVQWTSDGGTTWVDQLNDTYNKSIYAFLSLHDTLYAGGEGFYEYSDAVDSWAHMSLQNIGVIESLTADSSGRMYAAVGSDGAVISEDGGFTWRSITAELPHDSGSTGSIVAVGTDLYAAVSYVGDFSAPASFTGVWHSTDRGAHWTFSGQGIDPTVTINNLFVDMNSADHFVIGTSAGFYTSADGARWTHQSDFSAADVVVLPFDNIRKYMLGVSGAGLVVQDDHGNWRNESMGLPLGAVARSSAFDWQRFGGAYLGTDASSAWRSSVIYDTAVDEPSSGAPAAAQLQQSYPNPVGGMNEARIAISVLRGTHATLTVYDVAGRQVAVLFDTDLREGIYTVDFNAAGLPAGGYEYTLKTAGHTERRRLQIVR